MGGGKLDEVCIHIVYSGRLAYCEVTECRRRYRMMRGARRMVSRCEMVSLKRSYTTALRKVTLLIVGDYVIPVKEISSNFLMYMCVTLIGRKDEHSTKDLTTDEVGFYNIISTQIDFDKYVRLRDSCKSDSHIMIQCGEHGNSIERYNH